MVPGFRTVPSAECETDQADMIQIIAREVIKNELSLTVQNSYDKSITIQLMLGNERIGKKLELSIDRKEAWTVPGGQYVTGLTAKTIEKQHSNNRPADADYEWLCPGCGKTQYEKVMPGVTDIRCQDCGAHYEMSEVTHNHDTL